VGWGQRGKSKYGAKRTTVGNLHFASLLEASVYRLLQQRQATGEITNVRCQVPVRIKDKCDACGAKSINLKVDFAFEVVATGETVYCEAKGHRTNDYVKKERAWEENPPGKLEVWGGAWRKPKYLRTIG
jgi:hypothetical protein